MFGIINIEVLLISVLQGRLSNVTAVKKIFGLMVSKSRSVRMENGTHLFLHAKVRADMINRCINAANAYSYCKDERRLLLTGALMLLVPIPTCKGEKAIIINRCINAANVVFQLSEKIGGGVHLHFINLIRRHLLDNLDEKPVDETKTVPMKKKIRFPYWFFILTHQASPVSGPLHRLATEQPGFSNAWYMHNATAAD